MNITLETSVLPAPHMLMLAKSKGHDCVVITVTGRETKGSDIVIPVLQVPETAVYGESLYGQAVFGGQDDPLNKILAILSDGSFPPPTKRGTLTEGELHQLRDAMIFAAHVREKRDIFVTADARAFINHGKREKLLRAFETQIMSPDEFMQFLNNT